MTDRISLADELKRMAAERQGDEHPQPDELLAYHFATLEGDRAAAVQKHLAVCPRCARTVLDMAEFPDIEPRPGMVDPPEPGEQEMAALERRFTALGPANDNTGIGWMRFVAPYLVAALVLACVGLGWRLEVLDSRLDEARSSVARLEEELAAQPKVDHSFEIVSLQPIGAGEDRSGPDRSPILGSDMGFLPLVLNVYLPEEGPYSVELVDVGGKIWRTWSGLEPTSRKNLTLVFPSAGWPPGDYELRVRRTGADAGSSPLASFPITIGP